MKQFITAGIIVISLVFPTSAVFAQSSSLASPIQKAFENIKDTIDNLVTAKDQNSAQELSFRVQTFKKVLDFVGAETRDVRVKLFLVEDFSNKDLIRWRNKKVTILTDAIKYYDAEKKLIENNEKSMTIDDVKNIAKDFKDIRDTKYVGAIEEVKEFVLITQEKSSVDVAKSRINKILYDVKNINSDKLKNLSDKAAKSIKDAEDINNQANDLFWSKYINPQPETNYVSATTTDAIINTETSTESTDNTGQGSEEPIPPSIKDLVKNSLLNIKDAYQTFIEMSSLVRKGL